MLHRSPDYNQENDPEIPDDDDSQLFSRAERIEKARRKRCDLWHRRFGHVHIEALRNLHTATDLSRFMTIPPLVELCVFCQVSKMRKFIPKIVAKHKKES